MTQAAQGAGGLGAAAGGGGGTTAPGYSASANYGAGMSGAQTSTYDAVMRATGSPQLANMVTQGASGITQMWGQLTPAQRAQLGGSLGGLLATAASGGGSSANTAGQRTAGNMQLDVARQLQGLGTSEIAALGQRRASSDASFDQIIQAALRSQQTNDGRSQQLWDEMTTHYLPAGRRLAETAANYDTAGRREAAGAEAVAGVDAQLARQREGFGRDLRLSGGTMDAGRGATMDLAQRFAGAKLGAGADRVARQGVEDRGIALNQGVAQLGQGMGSMANSTSQIGLSAGGLATGAVQGRQGAYNAALTPAHCRICDSAMMRTIRPKNSTAGCGTLLPARSTASSSLCIADFGATLA